MLFDLILLVLSYAVLNNNNNNIYQELLYLLFDIAQINI